MGKVRGKGGFSDVYAAEIRGKPGTYALKVRPFPLANILSIVSCVLKVMLVPTPERLDMAKNECKYLAELQSPNIVRLHASKIEGEKVFMLLDFYDVRRLLHPLSSSER